MRKKFFYIFLIVVVLFVLSFSLKRQNNIVNSDNSVEKLKSFPYLTWYPIDPKNKLESGVTIYDKKLAFKGVNIYNSRNKAVAHLIDMEGNILHTWANGNAKWLHIEMNDRGDMFAIAKDELLLKLDWNSHMLWTNKSSFHHDIDIAENGDVYSITSDIIKIPYKDRSISVIDDHITILSPEGKTKKRISLFHLMGEKIIRNRGAEIKIDAHLNERPAEALDAFHVNSIEIIKKNIENFAHKGDVLISIREWNLTAVVDLKKEEIVWSWGEEFLRAQHQPTLLDNGNILIFDNHGNEGQSRIVEMNPESKEVEWIYQPLNRYHFYSDTLGGNQKLPNGNLLITESTSGRVYELKEIDCPYIMPIWAKDYFIKFKMVLLPGPSFFTFWEDQEVVWEFWNPEIDKEGNKRAAIYRMMRLDSETLKKLPFDSKTREHLKENGYFN